MNSEIKYLKDVTKFIARGITPSYDENGVRVINQRCIRNKHIQLNNSRITNPEKRKIAEKKFLRKYDVLVNSTGIGTLGRVAQIKSDLNEPLTVDSHVTIIRPDQKVIDGLYFGYAMINAEPHITFLGEGSTGQIELSRKRLASEIEIHVPNKSFQKKIASILSSIDNKLELNNEMNRTLEALGQAIFRHWFIDFEFPDENGQPYKSSGGEMIDSELGQIPQGWKVGRLSDLLKIQIGGDWGEDQEFRASVPVICLRGVDLQKIKETGISNEAPIRWIKKSSLSKRKLDECDVLLGASGLGPVGRSLYFAYELQNNYPYPIIYSNFCKRLRSNSPEIAIYAEKIIEFLYEKGIMDSFTTGTSIPNLDHKGLLNYELIIPPIKLIEKYSQFMKFKYKQLYKSENSILSQLRDTLLPKLMSGKIRVPLEDER